MNRIGGEFEISLDDLMFPSITSEVFNNTMPNCVYLDTGRSSLYISLQSILKLKGKKIAWLPIYTCNSVIYTFQLCGFEIRFYSMGTDLQSPSGLPNRLDGETFLLIHYFGKRNEAIFTWLSEKKKDNSFFIIEDCVQALLTEGVGEWGDFSINSYRKFLPLPDGSMLCSNYPIDMTNIKQPDEEFISRKTVGKLLRQYSANDEMFIRLFAEAERRIDSNIIPRKMSWISKYLFVRMDLQVITQKRRHNWLILKNILETINLKEYIHSLFNIIDDGEVPLGFPIIIKNGDRDKLRQYLATKNIFCPIHWPLIPKFYNNAYIEPEIKLSESILTLPIDQRIDQKSIEYMVEQILNFYKNN
jgi:hypothetical protein